LGTTAIITAAVSWRHDTVRNPASPLIVVSFASIFVYASPSRSRTVSQYGSRYPFHRFSRLAAQIPATRNSLTSVAISAGAKFHSEIDESQ